jgi:hypothetical protein
MHSGSGQQGHVHSLHIAINLFVIIFIISICIIYKKKMIATNVKDDTTSILKPLGSHVHELSLQIGSFRFGYARL